MFCKTFIRSPYPFLLTIFFVKCLIVAELPVTPTNGTDANAAKVEWPPHPLAQYYVVIIRGLDDVIFDDLVYVGEQTSLEIHYNTLVTKKAEKKPEKVEVCPVVSAMGNGTVIARTTIKCLSKFNKHSIPNLSQLNIPFVMKDIIHRGICIIGLVYRWSLQYSSQIVETDTVSLEFSRKFLRFSPDTFVLTVMCPLPPQFLNHAYFEALRSL